MTASLMPQWWPRRLSAVRADPLTTVQFPMWYSG